MKKVLALALSAVMVAALAGCGSGQTQTSGSAATEAEARTTAAAQTTEAQTTTAAPATQEPLSEDVKKQLDEVLTKESYKGVAQITRGGEVIYQYAAGDDDNGQPLTIDSSLPLASVSKQICAAAVMLLSEKQSLSVDDTLDKYYPDYKNGKKITIRHLLTMSSGLPDYYGVFMEGTQLGADEAENVKTIKAMLFGEELNFEPGDDYSYSNSNYFLLADIVEQVSGVSYHEFLKKNIFEPLSMTRTGFVEEANSDQEWAAALPKKELMTETTCPGLAKGAGDIVSDAADMDKWMRGLSSGAVISSESFRQMTEDINPNSFEGYGYGLSQMPYDGVGHVGQIPPHFGSVDYLNTGRDVYLFAASNDLRGSSFVQQLPQALLDVLFK